MWGILKNDKVANVCIKDVNDVGKSAVSNC